MSLDPKISAIEQNRLAADQINLREYWDIFAKHKIAIFGITIIIGLLAAMVAHSLPAVYRGTATLLIESDQPNVISIEQVYGTSGGGREFYQTQSEILRTRALATKLIDRMELTTEDLAKPKDALELKLNWRDWLPEGWIARHESDPERDKARLIEQIRSKIEVEPLPVSSLIQISFESYDRNLAARIPNELAEIYIESDLEARVGMTERASQWLTERFQEIRTQLADSERALQEFREREQLVDVKGVKSTSAQVLTEAASDLTDAKSRRAEAENAYRQVQALRGGPLSGYESVPAVLRHPLVQKFKQDEAQSINQIKELKQRYGPKHPRMIEARERLASARKNLQAEIGRVITAIEREYEIAAANERAISRNVSVSKKEIQEINRKEYRLSVLEREVETNRNLYNTFLQRIRETDVAEDKTSSTIARIVDPAVPPIWAHKPNRKLIVISALILAFAVSLLLAFLVEHLDNTLKETVDITNRLKRSVMGSLPRLSSKLTKPGMAETAYLSDSAPLFSEAIRSVRTSLILSNVDNRHQVVVVTSSIPSEGKTTVSTNLALALGQMEKVLLIDADMRRPSVGKVLDLSGPGLSELVVGTAEAADCIQRMGDSGLYVLTSGTIPPNPLELLSSPRLVHALASFAERFDRVIIDAPPVGAVSDPLVLSRIADGVLFVTKAESTSVDLVLNSLSKLDQVESNVLGVVLNSVEGTRKRSGYYGTYYGKESYSYAYAHANADKDKDKAA